MQQALRRDELAAELLSRKPVTLDKHDRQVLCPQTNRERRTCGPGAGDDNGHVAFRHCFVCMIAFFITFMQLIPLTIPTPFYVGDVNVYLIKEDPLTLID